MYDTIIRGGTLVDGSGAAAVAGDLALRDGLIVEVGGRIAIQTVGEGIETISERDHMTRLGCDLLQGFFHGRPAKPFAPGAWDGEPGDRS